MIRSETDVFVIGGGPAGLAAAIAARQKGFSVTVADGAAPPIDKPCGEGLMPETQNALGDLGISLRNEPGYSFSGIRFLEGQSKVQGYFAQGMGLGIRRTILHERLIERAEQVGVQFHWKTPVTGITDKGVNLSNEFVEANWIVGADGSASRVRRWAGLDAASRRTQRFATRRHYHVKPWSEYMEIYWTDRTQAYVTPVSSEEVCVVMMAEIPRQPDFSALQSLFPELHARLHGAAISSRERGTVTTMLSLHSVCRGNVALVGDASGSVDAITGEGMRLAFRQAQFLARAMESGDLQSYAEDHRTLMRRPTFMANLLLLLGKNEPLRHRAFPVLNDHPELFTRILEIHTTKPAPSRWLATGALLGWHFLAS